MPGYLILVATVGWGATIIFAIRLIALIVEALIDAPIFVPAIPSLMLTINLGGFGLFLIAVGHGLAGILRRQTETAALLRPIAEALGRATHDKPHG